MNDLYMTNLKSLEMKKTHEQMLNGSESLEVKVKERTAELEAANRELEAFSYTVSHDLQSPLRAIVGFSRILLTENREQLSREAVEHLETIDKNARRMHELIKDLLTFSKLGKEKVVSEPLDMNEVVEQVLTELPTNYKNNKAIIMLQSLQPAQGDASLIRQVWVNLLDNALKYSSKKESPVIEIGMKEVADEQVYFIKDNGAGFDMQYVDRLFGVFQRIHEPEEFEGSGIGLATVNRIITKHGGRIWAEAKPGEGAIFYFTLGKG